VDIVGRFFGLVTKHACDRRTDGQTDTDRQNYDSQVRASIAAVKIAKNGETNRIQSEFLTESCSTSLQQASRHRIIVVMEMGFVLSPCRSFRFSNSIVSRRPDNRTSTSWLRVTGHIAIKIPGGHRGRYILLLSSLH